MSISAMEAQARKHWATWLPAKTAALKKQGMWEVATRNAAAEAQKRIQDLIDSGLPPEAAQEVAIKEHILLDPEKGAGVEDWEAEELAQREREYQETMAAAERAAQDYDRRNP